MVGYVLGDKPFYMHLKMCRQTMENYMFPWCPLEGEWLFFSSSLVMEN